ncbi:MAG TPA: glycosyltransferase [Candidatus Binataceae bacterium]|jgi:cellulose synthase/poly-beta-1,6-N-acetylglucosamine synthase-like glycosyltransferase|nr:glycosyltransferase [Candidatus Binataceae bacterium]
MSDRQTSSEQPQLSVVVIGRNEGARLARCFTSVGAIHLPDAAIELIYVDSASTDNSVELAQGHGAKVIIVDPERPCAAIGRNAGWRAARGPIVLFLDGDTILAPEFVPYALRELNDPRVGVVFGYRRELHPEASLYNRVLDLDWIIHPGEAEFCGGDAFIRRAVLESVGGYNERLIAGEDAELCARIRAAGYKIVCLDRTMVSHDLAITHFNQYWRRAVRSGHAYAEVSSKSKPEHLPGWHRQTRLNRLKGTFMIVLLVVASVLAIFTGSTMPVVVACGIVAALSLRTAARTRWKRADYPTRLLHGLHSHLVQIPTLIGQIQYFRNLASGRTTELIEYK